MTTINKTHNRKYSEVRQLVAAGVTLGMLGMLALGTVGCKSPSTAAPIVGPDGGDPAAANTAQPYTGGASGGYPADNSGAANGANGASAGATTGNGSAGRTRVLSSSQSYAGQSTGQDYGDPYGQDGQGAPIIRQAPAGGDAYPTQGAYPQGYTDAEEAGEQAIADTDQAPPPLPEYDQPPAPDPNYLWTPGYWDYASAGYYWVPGVWCAPPFYGALWTPAWWGSYGGHYRFHRGYWGPHVGFYGGINYGFGFIGTGYYGGYWRGHDFYYNRAVTNVNVTNVHNVYNRTVVYNDRTYGPRPDNRVAFNGGRGGVDARPNPSELAALHEAHYAPVAAQRDNRMAAASNRGQFVRADGGRPAMAFAARPAGSPANIAAAPREQPFNHPGAPGLTGQPTTPNGAAAGGRPGTGPGTGPGAEPGRFNPGPGARPGGAEVDRNANVGLARNGVETGHPTPAAQGFGAGRNERTPGAGTPPNGINGAGVGRPGTPTPGNNGNARPGVNGGNNGHGYDGGAYGGRTNVPQRPGPQPAARQPAPAAAPVQRQAQPVQHQAQPVQHQAQPAPAPRPEPAFRPEPAAPRPAPAPQAAPAPRAAPAPAAAPHAAPAPAAPHGGGAGGHR